MKSAVFALVVAAVLAGAPTASGAASGSIRITITRAQFMTGGGSGTLRFMGERYPLRVGGVSASPFATARTDLVGHAYNLQTAASIHGVYSTVTTGAPKSNRAGVFRLRNSQGVVLELRGRQGVKPPVDLSGLQISLR
jgi:hypothetical protein